MDRTDLARRIHDAAHLTGTFTLRSGVVSHEYFDKYRFESDPALLLRHRRRARAARARPASTRWPVSSSAASRSPRCSRRSRGLPALFVRKEAKTYGTCKLAEGGEIAGRRLCIVEDVVTSGGAVLDAAAALRERAAELGPVRLRHRPRVGRRRRSSRPTASTLHALYTMTELKAAAGA